MQKEIPKREGQRFNGTGVSVAALVFLLIGVPVASAYLIDIAIYFGGEEVEYNTTEPPYSTFTAINTGSSDAARCVNNSVDALDICYGERTGAIRYFKGEKYHTISGCENYTNNPSASVQAQYNGNTGFCGSDNYDFLISVESLFIQNRTFPAIEIEFVGATSYICDSNYFGSSKVDFKLTFSRYSATQLALTPNGQLAPVSYAKNDTFSITDTANFDNGGTYVYEETDLCNPTVSFTYSLSLSELSTLEDFREGYFESNTTFELVYLIVELDNFRTESGTPYDYSNYYLPFQGAGSDANYGRVSVPTYEVDAVNFTLKIGVFAIGLGFWILAIASTPFWNPIKERFA
jgi:hypothetical protein